MTATKVYADVEPANDGTIPLDFSTADAFLNAVEILPSIAHRALPIRIVGGYSAYRDSHGSVGCQIATSSAAVLADSLAISRKSLMVHFMNGTDLDLSTM
jgi:hypothetical protein